MFSFHSITVGFNMNYNIDTYTHARAHTHIYIYIFFFWLWILGMIVTLHREILREREKGNDMGNDIFMLFFLSSWLILFCFLFFLQLCICATVQCNCAENVLSSLNLILLAEVWLFLFFSFSIFYILGYNGAFSMHFIDQ